MKKLTFNKSLFAYNKFFVWLVIAGIGLASCKKFVQISPPITEPLKEQVFANDNSATSAIVGIYSQMSASLDFSFRINAAADLCADDFVYTGLTVAYQEFSSNSISIDNSGANTIWVELYKFIYYANSAIEGIEKSTTMTDSVKNILKGECKFIRSYCYFYLVNLYGDVPLVLTTDYRVNSIMPRTPTARVYQQIVDDLTEARNLLPVNYMSAEKARPNRWAAVSLLARTQLYVGNWALAESLASEVIATGTYTSLVGRSSTFKKESKETIWQLVPVTAGFNTLEGGQFVTLTGQPPFQISDTLYKSFETNDGRKEWLGSTTVSSKLYYHPKKYINKGTTTPLQEYYIVLRAAELYLIRAEARAQQNKITDAIADLNVIRARASGPGVLPPLSNLTQAQCIAAVAKERRFELMAEWGHRWLDLKRTNQADAVLSGIKKPNWQPTDVLWPIPLNQRNANPFLTQNPGY